MRQREENARRTRSGKGTRHRGEEPGRPEDTRWQTRWRTRSGGSGLAGTPGLHVRWHSLAEAGLAGSGVGGPACGVTAVLGGDGLKITGLYTSKK